MPTKIEWVRNPDGTQGETWNPIRGCSPASEGCKNCYAATAAAGPFLGQPGQAYHGLTNGGKWTGSVEFFPNQLEKPLHWRKPRTIFACSMSDIFHPLVTNEQIAAIFGVIAACPQHQFVILTKRPERAVEWYRWVGNIFGRDTFGDSISLECDPITIVDLRVRDHIRLPPRQVNERPPWPLPNLTVGVSVENQQRADERIPALLSLPAAKRIVSYEPALGPVDFDRFLFCDCEHFWPGQGHPVDCPTGKITGLICGSETGPGARPMDLDWARSARDQCAEAGVPFFFKRDSAGSRELDGRLHEEVPW